METIELKPLGLEELKAIRVRIAKRPQDKRTAAELARLFDRIKSLESQTPADSAKAGK